MDVRCLLFAVLAVTCCVLCVVRCVYWDVNWLLLGVRCLLFVGCSALF